ncbi:GTP cyclohydrolase FolE2 [Kiritimatiellota bacterium B12222]|nr:GTP cyclohydrolase FolE2 [Kiritimatiellota bacterium B12222]
MKSKQTIERDVQLDMDHRGVAIQQVGISQVKYPLTLSGIERDATAYQSVSAELSLSVSLEQELKGIHMSRLVEDLIEMDGHLSVTGLATLLHRLKEHQQANAASLSLSFDYYLDRTAPVSGRVGKQAYHCELEGQLDEGQLILVQKVEVPVTTLCPCSKEISAYGAHNQRGYVEVRLEHHFAADESLDLSISLEEVIEEVEASASAPLYPILKRTDERYVTMQAYEEPRFVEDMVRNVAVFLRDDARIDRWQVRVTNHESIHQHNAFAVVSGGR